LWSHAVDAKRLTYHIKNSRIGISTQGKGFSLVEVLIVLVIIVIVMSVVAPRFSNRTSSVRFISISREIASGLRFARMKAVTDQKPAEFIVNIEQRYYQVRGIDKTYPIPADIEISVYTAASQVVGEEQGSVLFFPDGSSSGGRIELINNGRKRSIDINWLTGLVETSEDTAEN